MENYTVHPTKKVGLTSKEIEDKGLKMMNAGKILAITGLCGLGLIVLICLISMSMGGPAYALMALTFTVHSSFAFVIPFMIIAYLAFLCLFPGITLYYNGLKLYALGRIAVNTEKEN